MTFSEFIFAVVPPVLAIAIERLGIPSDEYLAAKAKLRQTKSGAADEVGDMIREMCKGTVSMSSVAPTLVSFIATWFAIFGTKEPNAVLYDFGGVALTALATLAIVRMLNKYGPHELATHLIILPFKWRDSRYTSITPAKVIHWMIYLTNLALIAACIAVYFHWL
ncbi:MAG TPA: hypothetical protein VGI90_06145 [Steroidobacteraceae bacterium]